MSDALINGLSGAAGGIVVQLITYPLQTVNTRQQTERNGKEKNNVGTIEHMCQVVRQEGWNRLYGGLTPSLIGTATSQGIYYYFYQIFRDKAEAAATENMRNGIGDGSVGMLSSLSVAALSGCLNVLVTNPIWVIVTRMQAHTRVSNGTQPCAEELSSLEGSILAAVKPLGFGTRHTIEELYAEAGVLGFWKGVFPALIMVSNPSIQFMLYETMSKQLKRKRSVNKITNSRMTSAMEIFVLGALAKLGATIVTYPLLVVKSRLQAKQATSGDQQHYYTGTFDAIEKMVRHDGLRGFYNGMRTKIVQSVLAAAVLFLVKEELVRAASLMHKKWARKKLAWPFLPTSKQISNAKIG